MKHLSLVISTALVLNAGAATADDIACQLSYGQTVKACAHTLRLLSPDIRAGAQRACVEGARLTQAYCMAATSVCTDKCLVAYDRSQAACEAVFDPAVCSDALVCAPVIVQQRDNCLSHTVGALDACTGACTPMR